VPKIPVPGQSDLGWSLTFVAELLFSWARRSDQAVLKWPLMKRSAREAGKTCLPKGERNNNDARLVAHASEAR
jgi:hypothetical protein